MLVAESACGNNVRSTLAVSALSLLCTYQLLVTTEGSFEGRESSRRVRDSAGQGSTRPAPVHGGMQARWSWKGKPDKNGQVAINPRRQRLTFGPSSGALDAYLNSLAIDSDPTIVYLPLKGTPTAGSATQRLIDKAHSLRRSSCAQ